MLPLRGDQRDGTGGWSRVPLRSDEELIERAIADMRWPRWRCHLPQTVTIRICSQWGLVPPSAHRSSRLLALQWPPQKRTTISAFPIRIQSPQFKIAPSGCTWQAQGHAASMLCSQLPACMNVPHLDPVSMIWYLPQQACEYSCPHNQMLDVEALVLTTWLDTQVALTSRGDMR